MDIKREHRNPHRSLEDFLEVYSLEDTYAFCLGDTLLRAYAQAHEQNEELTIPFTLSFYQGSKKGVIRCAGESLENPINSPFATDIHLGMCHVSPDGSLEFKYAIAPTRSLQIQLNQRLDCEKKSSQRIRYEYYSYQCVQASDLTISEYLESLTKGINAQAIVQLFDSANTKRITELLLGQIFFFKAECERINPTGALSPILTDAQQRDLQEVCGQLAGYCDTLKDLLSPVPKPDVDSLIDTIKNRIIEDYVQAQPVILFLDTIRTYASHGHIAGVSWNTDSTFGNGLSLSRMQDQAIMPLLRFGHSVSGLPEELSDCTVASHQLSLLSPVQYQRFSAVCSGLIMDLSIPIEQREGFGIEITDEIARKILGPQSTVLFTVQRGTQSVGFAILYTTFEMLSDEEQNAINSYTEQHQLSGEEAGYLYLVATDPGERDYFKRHQSSIYRTLMQSVENFCSIHGLRALLGDVWEDNTGAITKHEKIGWEFTGLQHVGHRSDGLVTRRQVSYQSGNLEPRHQSFEIGGDFLLRSAQIIGNPKEIVRARRAMTYPALNAENAALVATDLMNDLRPEIMDGGELIITASNEYLGGETCVTFLLRGQIQYTLRQALINQDFWHAPDLGIRINTLAHCVSELSKRMSY